jgi:hypothetical protein
MYQPRDLEPEEAEEEAVPELRLRLLPRLHRQPLRLLLNLKIAIRRATSPAPHLPSL